MKYIITINQAGVINAGLGEKTDLTDWAILSHIYRWQASSYATKDEGMVWINYANIIQELPLLGLKTKQSVSNRIKKLKALKLIEGEQKKDKRMFLRVTKLYENIAEYQCQGVKSEEHLVPENGQGVPENGHLGVPENGHTPVNYYKPINKTQKNKKITLLQYLSECKEKGVPAVPKDSLPYKTAVKNGVPEAYVILLWHRYKQDYATPEATKKYSNWLRAFSRGVKLIYYDLWRFNRNGECYLTSKGIQVENEMIYEGKDNGTK